MTALAVLLILAGLVLPAAATIVIERELAGSSW